MAAWLKPRRWACNHLILGKKATGFRRSMESRLRASTMISTRPHPSHDFHAPPSPSPIFPGLIVATMGGAEVSAHQLTDGSTAPQAAPAGKGGGGSAGSTGSGTGSGSGPGYADGPWLKEPPWWMGGTIPQNKIGVQRLNFGGRGTFNFCCPL